MLIVKALDVTNILWRIGSPTIQYDKYAGIIILVSVNFALALSLSAYDIRGFIWFLYHD
jgi:hypothetical protein